MLKGNILKWSSSTHKSKFKSVSENVVLVQPLHYSKCHWYWISVHDRVWPVFSMVDRCNSNDWSPYWCVFWWFPKINAHCELLSSVRWTSNPKLALDYCSTCWNKMRFYVKSFLNSHQAKNVDMKFASRYYRYDETSKFYKFLYVVKYQKAASHNFSMF